MDELKATIKAKADQKWQGDHTVRAWWGMFDSYRRYFAAVQGPNLPYGLITGSFYGYIDALKKLDELVDHDGVWTPAAEDNNG